MSNHGEDLSQFDISIQVIRYVLFKTHHNSGCPIRRDELTQLITKNYRQRNLPVLVINEAIAKLSSIFGYEMRELQRARPSSNAHHPVRASQQGMVDAKSYVIMSKLTPEVYKKYVEDGDTVKLSGFAFLVLSVVHISGENLWQYLRRMGLDETKESHPVLGNTKQALEALVLRRYLQKDKQSGPEGNSLIYELAERALDPQVNTSLKDYISQFLNKDIGAAEMSSAERLIN